MIGKICSVKILSPLYFVSLCSSAYIERNYYYLYLLLWWEY